MAKKKSLSDAAAFFYEYAGSSYTPGKETQEQGRRRGAKSLAEAEREADRLGIRFEWLQDSDADISWMDAGDKRRLNNGTAEMMTCIARSEDGKILASLHGIHMLTGTSEEREAGRNYARVVEAELAMEAIG